MIGIETDRGPWVSALVAAGYHVYAINPRSASRYRDRHHVGGAKSDAGDARLLADLVRTDRHNHREVAGDSDEAGGVRILARAHQQLIWDRVRQTNRLRTRSGSTSRVHWRPSRSLPTAMRWACCPARPPARGGAAEHLPDPLRAQARRPPAQPRAARRRGPRGVALPQLEAPAAVSKAFAASTGAAMRGSARSTVRSRSSRPSSRPILSSTRTPASTVPCPVSVWSSAPGCSASSGMTPNATTRRSPAGTTPVPRH